VPLIYYVQVPGVFYHDQHHSFILLTP